MTIYDIYVSDDDYLNNIDSVVYSSTVKSHF